MERSVAAIGAAAFEFFTGRAIAPPPPPPRRKRPPARADSHTTGAHAGHAGV
jgi:hypothetical protein